MFTIVTYGKQPNNFLTFPAHGDSNREPLSIDHFLERISDYKLFNFVTLKKIKPNKKYIVYLDYYYHILKDWNSVYNFNTSFNNNEQFNYGTEKFSIPERIYQDSENGLVHWLIDYQTEAHQLLEAQGTNFNKLCLALNADPKNITLITGAETQNSLSFPTQQVSKDLGYNIVTGYDLHKFLWLDTQVNEHNDFINKKIKSILNKDILKFKSLCYNRRPRPHRTIIVAHILKHYEHECLYSLGTFSGKPRDSWNNYFPELRDIILYLVTGPEIYPHIKEQGVSLEVNLAHTLGWDHGLNSYFQLVTETAPAQSRYPFITEKSLKPFAMMQPFIQYGPKDNVKNLKNYGYDIFEKWIDHSYDDTDDDIERLRLVLKEFDRLQNISSDKWSTMLKEMAEPILHNVQLVKKPVIRDLSSQLIPILHNFLEQN